MASLSSNLKKHTRRHKRATLFGKPRSSVVKHPGAATAKAQAEGLTVHEWAVKHQNDPGIDGKQARLALTFERFNRK